MVRAGGRSRFARAMGIPSAWPVGSLTGAADRKAGYDAGRPSQECPCYIRARRRMPRSLDLLKLTPAAQLSETNGACAREWPAQNSAPRGRAGSMPRA